MKTYLLPIIGSSIMALAGCAPFPVGPGDKPGDTPPRIVIDSEKGAIWDNPATFGPVPAELQSTGNAVCQHGGFKRATGYHPRALTRDGQAWQGGGYFCVDSDD